MLDKVLVAVGLKKKMCEYCNAAPVHEGYKYCGRTCGTYAKMQPPPAARGPPRNPPRSGRDRGPNARGHGPPPQKICITCGTRPVYKNRDYCTRSCSQGVPWSAPPYQTTNNRDRQRGPPRADGARERRHSDYNPRVPDSRRQPRRGHESSDDDDDDLPDTPPQSTTHVRSQTQRTRAEKDDDDEDNDYGDDSTYPPSRREPDTPARREPYPPARREPDTPARREPHPPARREPDTPARREPYTPARREPYPPARREPQRSQGSPPPPKPPPKTSHPRTPSAATSGSPWPPKTPQPRPRPRELGPYDEPYQSD